MEKENQKISVVLNTYNASAHLAEVLESAKDFDEIVVCDMESADNTRDIALKYGAKVIIFPKKDYTICEPARDTAIHAASNRWVLVVDADEVISPALKDYLYRYIKKPDCAEGLRIPRVNRFLGRYDYRSPELMLRFFRQDLAHWPETIHSIVKIEGSVESVERKLGASPSGAHLLHLDDAPVNAMVAKMNNYTDRELERRAGKRWGTGALIYRPIWAFLRSYIVQGGWRYGRRGVIQAVMKANYQSVLVAKLMEKRLREE